MGLQYKYVKRFVLGFTALVLGLVVAQTSRAGVGFVPQSANKIAGMWASNWSVDGVNVTAGLAFLSNGQCILVVLNEKGEIIQRQNGSYTFEPSAQRIGGEAFSEGVLTLRIGDERIVEKVRWLGRDYFVFVGSEKHPWVRIRLTEERPAPLPEEV